MAEFSYGSIIIGFMSIIVVVYRITNVMIPHIRQGINEKDYIKICEGITMIV